MKNTVYTIGYTSFDQKQFIQVLKELDINCVIDVRSVPASSQFPQYNKSMFEPLLKKEGIKYRNYTEFGARQEDRQYYSDSGYLDFEVYSKSSLFQKGISKVCQGMQMGFCFVLMCAEKDPINCHRSIMISKSFVEKGIDIQHIRTDKNGHVFLETQKQLEKRLVKLNGDDLDQISLLDSDASRIKKAYQRQNRIIGFKLDEE